MLLRIIPSTHDTNLYENRASLVVDQIVVHVDSSRVGQEVSLGENKAFQLHPRLPPLLANYRTGL